MPPAVHGYGTFAPTEYLFVIEQLKADSTGIALRKIGSRLYFYFLACFIIKLFALYYHAGEVIPLHRLRLRHRYFGAHHRWFGNNGIRYLFSLAIVARFVRCFNNGIVITLKRPGAFFGLV